MPAGEVIERGIVPVAWSDDAVLILDQTRLPFEQVVRSCADVEAVCLAIRELAVRGAPAIGVAAGYAMALAARTSPATSGKALHRDLRLAKRELDATRPTAVNLAWATARVLAAASALGDPDAIRAEALKEAVAIESEDRLACDAMGRFGATLVPDRANVLTHCNTGHLCTAGIGTAQGIIETAFRDGKRPHVWVDETRPLLQGARLTAWELQRLGIPMTLVADNQAASLMAAGKVDLVITGADRVAANGDAANKIGTYGLAVLAKHHGVPFVVVAPVSTIDADTPDGAAIVIEERDPDEILAPRGVAFAPVSTHAANPAFDVTPGSLIKAIVTDRGVAEPPFRQSLRRMLKEGKHG